MAHQYERLTGVFDCSAANLCKFFYFGHMNNCAVYSLLTVATMCRYFTVDLTILFVHENRTKMKLRLNCAKSSILVYEFWGYHGVIVTLN